MQYARVLRHIEIGVRAMQQTTVVPHQQITHAPVVAVDELRLGGVRFEFECYDVGHILTLAFYLREGVIRKPVFVQFVLGVLGGIDASPQSLMHMKATADRLLGENYRFSVLAAGRMQIALATLGAILGGNVRVGLEDSLLIGKEQLATSNAEQVRKIRRIVEELGYEVATPAEAREMLNLKGADKVNF